MESSSQDMILSNIAFKNPNNIQKINDKLKNFALNLRF